MTRTTEQAAMIGSVLRRYLLGSMYTVVHIGDTWSLCFDRFWFSAHRISSPDEPLLSAALAATPLWKSIAVDAEEIPAAAAVLANRRQPVVDIAVGADASLTIHFANERQLHFPTATDGVDWQWSITRDNSDPYMAFLVACFSPAEITVSPEAHDP